MPAPSHHPAFAASAIRGLGLSTATCPDEASSEQYEHIRADELGRLQGEDLARLVPRGFKSRFMEAGQLAYEKRDRQATPSSPQLQVEAAKGCHQEGRCPVHVVRGTWDNKLGRVGCPPPLLHQAGPGVFPRGPQEGEERISLEAGLGMDWTGTSPRGETAFSWPLQA